MPEAENENLGRCPFHSGRTPAQNPLASTSISPSPSEKLKALKEFIAAESFICKVGAAMEKAGTLKYSSLQKPSKGNYLEQLRKDTAEFIKAGKHAAWIIIFDQEPKDYEELSKLKTNLCGDLIASLALSDYWHGLTNILGQIKNSQVKTKEPNFPNSDQPTGYPCSLFRDHLAAWLKLRINENAFDPLKSISDFGRHVYSRIPNTSPMLDQSSLQLVVMSPLYHQSTVSTDCPVLKKYEIEHGRFAPVSCLVVTHMDEVNRSKATALGAATQRAVAKSTLIYNTHASNEGKYHPSDILAAPFYLKDGVKADEELMQNVDEIVTRLMRKEIIQQETAESLASLTMGIIYELPVALRNHLLRLTNGSTDPIIVLRALDRLQTDGFHPPQL